MSDDINKMDFKQLRNEVQMLRDELAIMKRKYEDIIYNLDDDNFSSRFVKEKGDMKTAIEITAEGIKTKVSKEELDKSLESTKTQTAAMISSEVSTLYDNDATLTSEISRVEQTANRIESTVTSVFQEITEVEHTSQMTDKSKIYTYNGTNYHYNKIQSQWEEIEGNSIASSFIQTSDGFQLNGDVSISGDAIVSGTISASRIDTENLSCTRLYAKSNFDGYSARLNGNWGDFGIFNSLASANASSDNANCMFGIYNSFPNVNLFVYGNNFMGYDVHSNTIWAKGKWDFSVADVTLPDGVTGGGSGAPYAIFG